MYTIKASSPTFGESTNELSSIAVSVLNKRYAKRSAEGEVLETPEEVFHRVATAVANVEPDPLHVDNLASDFYFMMTQGLFMPNSPTIMNAGRPLGMLSACFVLPVNDNIEGIYDTLKHQALIHKSGGGTGFDFSQIRPKGDTVFSTTGVASGPVSFMEVYNNSTEAIKQGGTRRGANMGILRVDHPDIREFITVKQDLSRMTNFNVSVAATDEFMQAVLDGEVYELINPRNGEVVGVEDAREIFDLIVDCAWKTGEPGLFFIDTANYFNPVPHLGAYEATNPCGEQPLLPYDVCNLGSINLGKFVKGTKDSRFLGGDLQIDYELLRVVIEKAVRFLDNVIEANRYPLSEIERLSKNIRRIGLGVMGWADMLVKLGIAYDSPRAIELANEVMNFVQVNAHAASESLAHSRGAFPEWERSIWGPDETCARNGSGERIAPMRRMRNCNTTTVAPTGTISMFANCSSGIEPLFAVAFTRNQADMIMVDFNPNFPQLPKEVMQKVAETGRARGVQGVPEEVAGVWVTAGEVPAETHVAMQAVFQAHCDSAISKTINLPNDATQEDVRNAYLRAYELGCKGITVYRDGSRSGQVLSVGTQESTPPKVGPLFESIRLLESVTPFGHLRVFVTDVDGQPKEVFLLVGRAGSDVQAFTEGMGRVISIALRNGVAWDVIAEQLIGIGGSTQVGFGSKRILSVPDAVGKLLRQAYGGEEVPEPRGLLCPSCGSLSLALEEGCKKCYACGYSEC